jgi:hypothetical protein
MIFRDPEQIKIGMIVIDDSGKEIKITSEKLLRQIQQEYWEYEPLKQKKK